MTQGDVEQRVPGTRGYADAADRFLAASEVVSFDELHADVLPHLPVAPCRALDAGAGSGRDALELARRGHAVVAVEPLDVFREAGSERDPRGTVDWRDDALPELSTLRAEEAFGLVLCHAVWHHLAPEEQERALARLADLLEPGGVLALGLRHGPAGVGGTVYDIDVGRTVEQAVALGLEPVLRLGGQPSLLPGKPDVTWTRLVLAKRPGWA